MFVEPQLLVSPAGQSVQIAAVVRSTEPGRWPWRLSVEVDGPGGRSVIHQSGVSDGSDKPVTRSSVNADATGLAVLEVEQPDGSTLRRTLELGAPAGDARRPAPRP